MSNKKPSSARAEMQNLPDTSALTSVITFRMAKAQSALNAQATRLLRLNSGLSLVEWRILLLLTNFKEAPMTLLASVVQMDKGQMSRKINKMIEKGLILSTPDPEDQRKHNLQLSSKAHSLREQMQPVMDERQKQLRDGISQEEMDVFFSVLSRVEKSANKPPQS